MHRKFFIMKLILFQIEKENYLKEIYQKNIPMLIDQCVYLMKLYPLNILIMMYMT